MIMKRKISKLDFYKGEIKIVDMFSRERLDKFSFRCRTDFDKKLKDFFKKIE